MRIRLTTEKDIPQVKAMESALESRSWVYQWTAEQHRETFQEPDTGHWVLENEAGEMVGYCIMKGLKNAFGVVELMRIVIGPKGQGYGRSAMEAVMHKVFSELKARKLWLDVVEENSRAIGLYEALGFVHEGTLRESALIEGKPVSMKLYGMLDREWQAQ